MATKRNFRKRKTESESEEEAAVNADDQTNAKEILENMEHCKKKQKYREWKQVELGTAPKAPVEEAPKWGLQSKDAVMTEFTDTSNAHKTALDHEDKMNAFIEAGIKAARGRRTVVEEEPQHDGTQDDEVAKMKDIDCTAMQTPDHLKKRTSHSLEDANRWLTGIQEVQLPVEFKIRTIEDTEKVKRQTLKPEEHRVQRSIPSNFNANYTHHKRFMVTAGNTAPKLGGLRKKEADEEAAAKGAEEAAKTAEDHFEREKSRILKMLYARNPNAV